ncbi:LysR family transcriptional regulator, chromosome initiation inhibitor [Brevibacterium aurantiacum]|uniref:ArgP/LysG family DNA-binding transcriptional regulator n=1 Tax=Brevibacterium aurantiacum TaxID=273384 RepID=A0A2A3X109_BREAU|nr:ArgP/LysG family DNA-binding transcriptional regulator [Brevibacterium aurantiacum]PCC17874.1 HTH-type transcriptional regulator ArgP [Brevibacterium aurantiacum]PCC46935.1 HTH-type transcriptional regulator ArgP [Brevibacterium aurantiacum]RCS97495.1 ArgP/LysG family DNA-binding transcriptional regulator [Brevibacterium aurantiacum]SMX79343.1 LysR family transcriptional regulator, chromosome initiation inhibitor [Brevibacterium aurantiacum]
MHNCFMNIDHVKALAAVVDEGTVEGGAFVLGVTPSATSQRIRTLESRIGQVLIRRTNPITVTEAGEAVLKYAREIELLESETMDRLHGIDIDAPDGIGKDAGAAPNQRRRVPTVLRIGVNADSLSTWFRPIFAEVADWDDIVIRIEVADQDKALPLLTSGEVLGTITSAEVGGYGTQVQKLGSMRYVAVATKGLLAKYGAEVDGGSFAEVDLGSLPMVNFGKDDDLQFTYLRRAGVTTIPPMSVVPSSWEFAAAVEAGVGWGLIPITQLGDLSKDLVPLSSEPNIDVPLYWHHWNLASEKLGRLTEALHRAAAQMR